MDLQDLKTQLSGNNLSNFYIFAGDEVGIMSEYVKKMKKVTNYSLNVADSWKEVKGQALHKGLFGIKSIFYVLNDKKFNEDAELIAAIQHKRINGILILRFDKIDSRSAWVKQFESNIIYFNKLSNEVLIGYIYKFFIIDKQLANQLVEICGRDYSRLMLEMDKLYHLIEGNSNKPADMLVRRAVRNGLINAEYNSKIFELSGLILQQDFISAFALARECIEHNEEPLVLIKLVFNGFKNLLTYIGYNEKVPQDEMNYYTLQQVRSVKSLWYASQVIRVLKTLQEIDIQLKSGRLDKEIALDYLIINIIKEL